MPSPPVFTLPVRSAREIRDSWIRTLSNGLALNAGISNPAVAKGSDYDIIGTAFARELAVGEASAAIRADAAMPDTATSQNLDRWLAIGGPSCLRRNPTGSIGQITITCSLSSGVPIVVGQQLKDSQGLRFQTLVTGLFGNQEQVPVEAVDTGSSTNHSNGDVLQWVDTPPYCDQNAIVGIPGGTDGLVLGSDGEALDDETPRSRLLSRFQGAAAAGNWGHVELLAITSSPYAQGAFVYPGVYGPSTDAFAITAAPQLTGTLSATSKNRDINITILVGTIYPSVLGLLPEHAYVVGFTPVNVATDVAILLSLPSAPTASPAGPGGGWLDGTPWPSSTSSGTSPCTVTQVTDAQHIIVNSTTAPPAGAHVAFISPTTWTLYAASVVSSFPQAGNYVLTLDQPLTGVRVGSHIFPQSVNQMAYFAALLQAFSLLGPGELTNSPTLVQRAYRHPTPQSTWPYSLDATMLRRIEDAGTEVLAASYISRSTTTPAIPTGLLINDATNATPIVISTTAAHGLTTGMFVPVAGVLGNTAANGQWLITVVDATHFSLNGSAGNGAYTKDGSVAMAPNILVPQNLSFYAT